MKIQSQKVFPLLAIFTIVITLGLPQAFAETITVSVPLATSVPGCEKTDECFIPSEVRIKVGDEVTWENDDTAAHTVTSGTATDGPSGVFDSGLFMAATTYSVQFDEEGDFPYFCLVHPWMEGIVRVGTGTNEKPSSTQPELISAEPLTDSTVAVTLDHEISGGEVTSMVADGNSNSLIIEMDTTENGKITVTLPRDVIDALVGNEDDEFIVIVDNEESSFEETKTSTDRTLSVEFPVGTQMIEIIGTYAIPEFGTIAVVILGIAIISIIAISSKSRLNLMPKI